MGIAALAGGVRVKGIREALLSAARANIRYNLIIGRVPMIQVQIRLHGILREKLPAQARGRTTLSVPPGTSVRDVLAHFGLQDSVVAFALNEEVELDVLHALQDGDRVEIFRPAGGG